jgi:prevent-host-death family protein
MSTQETIEIGAFEAKNRLSALIDMAAHGQRIWITKHGRRMALLSSGLDQPQGGGGDLLEEFRKLRSASRSDGSSLKALIEEGRK